MENIAIFILVGLISFLAGFAVYVNEVRNKVVKGLLPYIDDSGSLSWKKINK